LVGTVNACITEFTLLCYVLGLLVSQQQIPLTMNVIFPKLSGESAYSLMTLLGKKHNGTQLLHPFFSCSGKIFV
jgi:ethylene-insensitive protein 2